MKIQAFHRCSAAGFLCFSLLLPARSESFGSGADLGSLSIEELMNVQVTAVSRQAEPLFGAASAIEVITADDISRYGAFDLPEALSLATGLQVARADVRTWAITARGLNQSTANKMQVMTDGRLLYTPLYSGIFWDAQNVLIEDIERIEVVRGPGATLWGANAVNGVISILTKEARDTQGWLASAAAGDHHEASGSLRYGGKLSDSTYFRVYGKYESDDELPTLGGPGGSNGRSIGQAGFRVDSYIGADDKLTVQGDAYEGDHGIESSADGKLSGGNILARWQRILSADSEIEIQAYFDATHRELPGLFTESRETFDLAFQQVWEAGPGRSLVWGANYLFSTSEISTGPGIAFVPAHRETHSYNAFAQYQHFLIPERLAVIFGAKVEENTLGGTEIQPGARFSWHPSDKASVWGSVARAVRKPTQFDTDLRLFAANGSTTLRGDPDFDSEKVVAYELGYRSQLSEILSADIAIFRNDYDDLRSLEPAPTAFFPFTFGNFLEARSSGAEISLTLKPRRSWTVQAGAAFLDLDFSIAPGGDPTNAMTLEENDPERSFHVRTSLDLGERWRASANYRYVGALPKPSVPSRSELDLVVSCRVTETLELTVTGRSLLESAHSEFGAQSAAATQVPRQVYAKAVWRY